ncbi:MAG: PD40 domain-containing protein, partial [Bacteroidetes bacterium]|nr:PD40 domain-containing protein [Bacteroidota bacterium]
MKKVLMLAYALILAVAAKAQPFTLEAIKGYPFPTELTASATGSRIAWALDELGKRNVYVAEGPEFKPRKLTSFDKDEGQEITSLSVSANGQWVVFVRGGDHSANWDDELPINTTFTAQPQKVQVYSMPFAGGEVKSLGEGDNPAISPKSDVVVFIKSNQVWTTPIDGSTAAKNLFTTRGTAGSLQWSPDGSRLAFTASRNDHTFIGVFTNTETPIQWIAPSFNHDTSPRWSPDGTRVAFVRLPGSGGSPDSIL